MARSFDGVDDYLQRTAAVLTGPPITLACWWYATAATAAMAIIELGSSTSGTNYFHLILRGDLANDPLRAVTNDGTGNAASTINTSGLNVWHHGAAVFASSTSRTIYYDGTAGTANTTSKTPTGIDRTTVGAITAGTSGFAGRIADAAIWSVALTAAEIAALARGVSPTRIRRASLVAYWPLFGTGSPEPDYSNGARHLTVTGAVVADHAPVMVPFGADLAWPHLLGGWGPLLSTGRNRLVA